MTTLTEQSVAPRPGAQPGRGAVPAEKPAPAPDLVQAVLGSFAALVVALLVSFVGLGQLQHLIAQQNLRAEFADQLAAGTAPVAEGDYNDVLLNDGDPVAQLRIPALGIDQTVVAGTTSATLTKGPGHRRDTVLPGQGGVSVIMGRAAAYGGPFAHLSELTAGAEISVVTGQGEQKFRVIGVRYAGETPPPAPTAGQGRLVLVSARGLPFMPSGLVRVDAQLVSATQPTGARMTTRATLPAAAGELAIDPSTVWALVFALQFLVIAEAGAVYCFRRFGWARTWVVFVPVLTLACLLVADQAGRLLPNLL